MQDSQFSLVAQSADLEQLIAKTKAFVEASKALSTRRSHASSWKDFQSWIVLRHLSSLDGAPTPEVIALYLADKASSLSPQTLTKRLCSITQALRAAGFEGPSPASTRQPLVGAVLRGIRRTKGVAPGPNQKKPLLTEQIRQLVATCGDDLKGIRDRALILVGYAGGGIRRSELVAIPVSAIEWTSQGILLHIDRSKTDQEGIGRTVGIPCGSDPETCPVGALQNWLDAACITSGPVFRAVNQRGVVSNCGLNPASVAYLVKRAARCAGLDDAALGAHSLRSGFCTQGHLNKASDRALMKQSGHKSSKSLDRYVRVAGVFNDNAAGMLGL
jgi:integrase